ncbi:MAG TPA: serine hydrolase domain-containing protein, partial [Candidatus Polarisedimenticolaceae bacterium]|nr:serine hydrolase domain-containing protein [Candidatus Polarisedimenticolaceae bacterium]
MRILLTSLLSFLLFLGAAAPPPLTEAELGKRLAPAVPPEGLSETVVGEEGRKADAWLTERAKAGFSGVVLAARDGKLVLAKGYGLADREAGTPFKVDSVFSIGSVTKQFTAAAILKLEQDGKLSVQDPITKFYPDAPVDKRAITLHQLLTHTAGLDSDFAGDYDAVDRDAYVGRILASKLRSTPGTTHHYANSGYSLLAAVVEKAAGMPYETYLREKLFLPAGMKETGYKQPAWPSSRVAVGYRGKERWGTILEKKWL